MNSILDFLNYIVLFILGISTIIGILDYVGLLPRKWKNYFKLNRSIETIEVLKNLGIDVDKYKRHNMTIMFSREFGDLDIKNVTQEILNQYIIRKPISVGHYKLVRLNHYYDLIGATCNPNNAEYCAKILSTYWAENSSNPDIVTCPDFDFIVTPKGGNPLLGYEFAKLCNRPLVLAEQRSRFVDNDNDDMRKWFNCESIPPKGQTALIVDDSITGAGMVSHAIDHLREYGYNVYTCYAIFEIGAQNGRAVLKNKNVELVSIIETHSESTEPSNEQ